jgi:hypothetical protein
MREAACSFGFCKNSGHSDILLKEASTSTLTRRPILTPEGKHCCCPGSSRTLTPGVPGG